MFAIPSVSVYIPTFNRVGLLARAVESVLSQTISDFEIIVVDDGSTDGTVQFMEKLADQDSRIVFLRNEVNSGACFSRNRAIQAARGKFVTGLDDDDYFHEDRLKVFLRQWQVRPEGVIALCSNSTVLHQRGNRNTRRPRVIYQKDLLHSNVIGNQIFALKETYTEVGGFDERFPAWQDLELWYRILSPVKSKILCVAVPTYVQDISHEHERISSGKGGKIKAAMNMFIEKHNIAPPYSDFLMNSYAAYGFAKPSVLIEIRKVMAFRSLTSVRGLFSLVVKRLLFLR